MGPSAANISRSVRYNDGTRITSYNVCYTKLLRTDLQNTIEQAFERRAELNPHNADPAAALKQRAQLKAKEKNLGASQSALGNVPSYNFV